MIGKDTVLNGTYRILEEIGSGGGGIVYKAYHERLKTTVVLKRIKENVKGILESRTEVDILKNIKHTYLPRVYDFLELEGEIFTVMDYIPGKSMAQMLAEQGAFPQKQVLGWAEQLAEALAYLHGQSPPVIHSDIKPANIMLTPAGNICLIDFNVSLAFDRNMRTSTGVSGGYSPPEQYRTVTSYRSFTDFGKRRESAARTADMTGAAETELMTGVGETGFMSDETEMMSPEATPTVSMVESLIGSGVDERSDIYSLGATLYHLLTGNKPPADFERGTSVEECGVAVSEGFAHILNKMMELDPDRRYQNGAEALYALRHIYELDSEYKAYYKKRRNRRVSLAILYTVSVALAVGGALTVQKEKNTAYNRQLVTAVSYMEAGEFQLSQERIEEARLLLPRRIDAYCRELQLYYAREDFDICVTYGRDLINNPEYRVRDASDEYLLGDIFYIVGNAYLEKDDFANAVNCFKEAVELNQNNSLYYRDYAIAEAKMGDDAEAKEILDDAILLGLREDSIYMVRAEIAFARRDYEEAETCFQKAVATAGSDSLRRRAVLLCAKMYKNWGNAYIDREISLLEQEENQQGTSSLVVSERLGDAYARKAKCLGGSQEYYRRALNQFEQVYAGGIVTYQVEENIAVLQEQLNEIEAAERTLQDMLKRYPKEYRVYKRLAFLEADRQQRRANQQRSYEQMRSYYGKAAQLYEQQDAEDGEMQMLGNMLRELEAGGWF